VTKIQELILQGKKNIEIVRLLNVTSTTVCRHKKYLKLGKELKQNKKYDWKEIQEYATTHTVKQTMLHFGFSSQTWTDAVNSGKVIAKSKCRVSHEEAFSENSQFPRNCLKKRILSKKLLLNECANCRISNSWENKPLILVLDHINGISNDNRLENLRFLCPNCNSQTETFSGRNKKYKISQSNMENIPKIETSN